MMKNNIKEILKHNFQYIVLVFFMLASMFALIVNGLKSSHAEDSFTFGIRLVGEYQIEDGEWNDIVIGEHIPAASKVTLKGKLVMVDPDTNELMNEVENGMYVALYFNHIGGKIIYYDDSTIHFDSENRFYGEGVCGTIWNVFEYKNALNEEITIEITNNHKFLNSNAVDDLLDSIVFYNTDQFTDLRIKEDNITKTAGTIIVAMACIFLGVAIFSSLLRNKNSVIIWLFGFLLLCAGGYTIYNSQNTSIWSKNIILNTTLLSVSIIGYFLFLTGLACLVLKDKYKKYWKVSYSILILIDLILVFVSLFFDLYLFDAVAYCLIVQAIFSVIIMYLLVLSMKNESINQNVYRIIGIVICSGLVLDTSFIVLKQYSRLYISEVIFIILFFISLFYILRVIPKNILASQREKQLSAELQESRIAIMISQIQPHFLYNTLTSIYALCDIDPQKAKTAIKKFSTYLRTNLNYLSQDSLISFKSEISFLEIYLDLEKMRFEDKLNVEFQLDAADFNIPALSIQPLVENAVKHGIGELQNGGTIIIRTLEDKECFKVIIQDNGPGFEVDKPINDGRVHVGLENVKYRLENMCNGKLEVESKVNAGTIVTVIIPKEK